MPTDSHAVARAVLRLGRRLRQERQTELTATQLAVLGAIRKLGPSTPSAIAAHERVQPPSITRTLNCLVEDGFALREPHPDDGRQVLITVSDKGETVLDEERARRDQWLAHRLSKLDTGERKVLRQAAVLLEKLADTP